MFLVLLIPVIAQENQPLWTAEVLPICEGVCLEGNEGVWLVEINNIGQIPMRVFQIFLVDNEDIVFGFVDLSQEEALIQAGQSGTVYVPGIVPPPSRSSTLFYKLNYVVDDEIYPDNLFRRMYVMPESEIECISNEFCERNEICAAYKCMPYSIFNSSEVLKPSKSINSDTVQIILLAIAVFLLMIIVLLNVRRKK